MNPYQAYHRHQNLAMPRIELALALYRKAMENLTRARAALVAQEPETARPFLLKTQLIVTSMAADLPAYKDAAAMNFLRLYEFVAHQMTLETIASVDAAVKVLAPLHEGFAAVREQAAQLERQGEIPSLDQVQQVSLSV